MMTLAVSAALFSLVLSGSVYLHQVACKRTIPGTILVWMAGSVVAFTLSMGWLG